MKRYVTTILIPCLLLQVFGCYSFKSIKNNEIEKFYQDEKIIIKTTDEREFILQKEVSDREIMSNPDIMYRNEYELKNNGLLLFNKKSSSTIRYDVTGLPIVEIKTDSIYIPNFSIAEIGYRRINPWYFAQTVATIVIVGVIVVIIGKSSTDISL